MGENEKTRKEVRIWTGCDRARKTEWVMATGRGPRVEEKRQPALRGLARFAFFSLTSNSAPQSLTGGKPLTSSNRLCNVAFTKVREGLCHRRSPQRTVRRLCSEPVFLIVLCVQTNRVPSLRGCYRASNPSVVIVTNHDASNRKGEFNSRQSHPSNLDASLKTWVDGVLLHERVTEIQSAKYRGDDNRHARHDD